MRLVGVDFLRGVAAFGIVGCHLSLAQRTAGGNLVTALCDFNVGLFAAVAGFLMCDGRNCQGWFAYVCKRVRRLLPIYFIWSVVFILATVAFDLLLDGGRLNPKYGTMTFWGRVVFQGDAATHLWFLICLFYAQVVLSHVFRVFAGRWHGLIWMILGAAMAFVSAMNPGWFYRYLLRLTAFLMTGYGVGCLLQGGALEICRKYNGVMWCVAVVVLVLHVVVGQAILGFVKDWMVVGPVMLAFIGWEIKGEHVVKIATFLGVISLGVYLIHPLVTRGLSVVVSRLVAPPFSAGVVLVDWILAWGMSVVVTLVLRHMPVVRRMV